MNGVFVDCIWQVTFSNRIIRSVVKSRLWQCNTSSEATKLELVMIVH